ncbi:MAG TPA: NAD(P)-dependent oxidoreductase [Thermomicrobiales bacterium]|nr:NAD(P)-dependent oxidoreductase [Thermomicrobiales bacterium]
MPSRVLVTGGAGFIGGYVVRLLAERGDAVVSLDTREPDPEARWWLRPVLDRITLVQGAMEDWSAVVTTMREHEPEIVVHVAAITNPVLLHRQPSVVLNTNLAGTFNLLEASRLFGVGRFVNFSTIGVLPGLRSEPVDADHPVLLATEGPGASFYGAGKVAAEAFCWAYRQSYGLDFVTIRPSAVYGFGMRYPIYVKPMVENAVNGVPTRFAQGREFPRDYTHAADVAQLAVLAAHHPAEAVRDRVFYGATGRPLVTAGRVAELVGELVPGADIAIGPGLSEADEVEIRYRGVLSIENARAQLGYEPRYADIRAGLAEFVETYRRYLGEGAA